VRPTANGFIRFIAKYLAAFSGLHFLFMNRRPILRLREETRRQTAIPLFHQTNPIRLPGPAKRTDHSHANAPVPAKKAPVFKYFPVSLDGRLFFAYNI